MSAHGPMPRSAWIFPVLAVILFAATTALRFTFTPSPSGLVFAAALLVILFGTVFAAVHHAEVIAGRIGEPYGTLLLTLAVTIIEVALIATIMLGEKPVPTLARDTVFAVVMIVCNGLAGVCIMGAGLRGHPGGAADPAAGERCRHRRRAQERFAEEHQSGARLVDCDHRADDPGGRNHGLHAGHAAGSRAQRPGDSAAGADVHLEHAHLRHWPHQYPVRAGSPGGVRRVRIPCVCALKSGE